MELKVSVGIRVRRGFTLLEVMIASVVFSLALTGMIPMIILGVTAGKRAHQLHRAVQVMNLVLDRAAAARQLNMTFPGPGGTPSDLLAAPGSGSTCYFLSTINEEAPPPPESCNEVADNLLISRQDVDKDFLVAWTISRGAAAAGSPVMDLVHVKVGWSSWGRRLHDIEGRVKVRR